MKGTYFGYDGPPGTTPSFTITHLPFTLTLYAVDVPKLKVKGDLTGCNVRDALNGHIQAQAKISGTYICSQLLREAG